jgi:hypothetical protein
MLHVVWFHLYKMSRTGESRGSGSEKEQDSSRQNINMRCAFHASISFQNNSLLNYSQLVCFVWNMIDSAMWEQRLCFYEGERGDWTFHCLRQLWAPTRGPTGDFRLQECGHLRSNLGVRPCARIRDLACFHRDPLKFPRKNIHEFWEGSDPY